MKKIDYSISFTRLMAMMFIVLCHILQYYDNELAWWFNVGVQMFLFISGYLYSRKETIDVPSFLKKNTTKILADFYVYAFFLIGVIILVGKYDLSVLDILRYLLLKGFPNGTSHFWFIPTILFCYLITPILLPIVNRLEEKSTVIFLLYASFLLLLAELIISLFFYEFNGAWVNCYILGLLFFRVEKIGGKLRHVIYILLLFGCLITNGVQIYVDYFSGIEFYQLKATMYYKWCSYAHVLLGGCIVIFLRWLYNKSANHRLIEKLLRISDEYSYDVYIVHQFFILGPHSVLQISDNRILAISLVFFLTFVAAFLLRKVTQFVVNLVETL